MGAHAVQMNGRGSYLSFIAEHVVRPFANRADGFDGTDPVVCDKDSLQWTRSTTVSAVGLDSIEGSFRLATFDASSC